MEKSWNLISQKGHKPCDMYETIYTILHKNVSNLLYFVQIQRLFSKRSESQRKLNVYVARFLYIKIITFL